MVFGFGFNKAKTFASAEKSVKQGKLHNAIADYEKIAHEDPRDLNVINNLGDLYARVGNVERAAECFRRCGEAYAREGFTVKAIAMYKKVTKQNPGATDAILKLAELYTLHGLYNDARVQYTQVAEHYQRSGQLDSAVIAFQKMLEFDPENSQLQSRLADLYVRSGKKSEARDLYFRSAQALKQRSAFDACDKALAKVLELEPGFAQAVLLRGQMKLEAGDAAGAASCLESLPDIDSRPEALRMLLTTYLKQANTTEAEPIARKLLTVYNDPSGITLYADSLISAGKFEEALGMYHEYAQRLMAADANAMVQTLHSLIARVKDHSRSLESLAELFQKAGDSTHIAEVTELLAHACVQEGQFEKARDLYHKLSEMEPENPLHLQNYRQMLAKLGQGDGIRDMTADESAQALMAEELEDTPPEGIEQEYPPQVKSAILDALTESELFASYNLPARAIPILEAALPQAPQDVQINQRLALMYSKAGQFAQAAERCLVLKQVCAEAGREKEAREYSEMAAKYRERAGLPAQAVEQTSDPAPVAAAEAEVTAPEPASDVAPAWEPAASEPVDAVAHEIDLSEEWDRVLKAEQGPDTADSDPLTSSDSGSPWDAPATPPPSPATAAAVGDLVEEARFYMAQFMWDEAQMALARAEAMVPEAPAVVELQAELAAAQSEQRREPAPLNPKVIDFAAAAQLSRASLPAAFTPDPSDEPEAAALLSDSLTASGESSQIPSPKREPQQSLVPPSAVAESGTAVSAGEAAQEDPWNTTGMLDGLAADLERSLASDFLADSPTEPPTPAAETLAAAQPAAAEFMTAPPAVPFATQNPHPVSPKPGETRVGHPTSPEPSATSTPVAEAEAFDPTSALSSLFDEFKRELETPNSEVGDDVETHYNLGLAFKEMGLVDEAIAEFQKAASAVERGNPFPQVLETYTWLADCFVTKGVPEAGMRWYKKALALPDLSAEQTLALHYELACAEQAAGDLASARNHFLHVLSLNIDYRDVTERIKGLTS